MYAKDDAADTTTIGQPRSKRQLLDHIDRLTISADAKAILANLVDAGTEIGGKLVYVGRRILDFALETMKLFPNTAFGLILAFVVATLIATVPLLGAILSPVLTPLLLAFGLASGAIADLRDAAISARVRRLADEFSAMTGAV